MQGKLAIPWGKRFHAALVYDGRRITEYLDGVRGNSMARWGKLDTVQMLAIGRDHKDWDALGGAVNDAMIFAQPLSAKEIQMIVRAQYRK